MESLWLRPTFSQHFDTVVVDFRWVERGDETTMAKFESWAKERGLRVVVDFSSGINLYPDLRLCNNSADEFERSLNRIQGVLSKMRTLLPTCAKDALFSFHNAPENYYTEAQCQEDFRYVVDRLNTFVGANSTTWLHLRTGMSKPPSSIAEAAAYVNGQSRWKIAPDVGLLLSQGLDSAEALRKALNTTSADTIGLWLVGAPMYDPLVPSLLQSTRGRLADSPDAVVDAVVSLVSVQAGPYSTLIMNADLRPLEATAAQQSDAEFLEVSCLEARWCM